MCNDDAIYYCKFRSSKSFKEKEIDCLAYEIVCNALLKKLNIPTPEIALVQLTENSFDAKDLKANKRYAKPGIICFGSKEIPHADLVTGIGVIESKRDYNQFTNPLDLLKIAMFDIWVDNTDRGKNDNFNILIAPDTFGSKFIAFDNAFCFGGVNSLRTFNELWLPTGSYKLIRTPYFKAFRKYFDKNEVKEIVDNLLCLHSNEIEFIISDVFKQIPQEWQVETKLDERILRYLTNENRLQLTKQIVFSHF
jgi:hypothetical protein